MAAPTRFGRLLKIRALQLDAAQAELVRSESVLREAVAITTVARVHLESANDAAVAEGEFSIDDLMEARARVDLQARRLKDALHEEHGATTRRNVDLEKNKAMALKHRQVESMNETALAAWTESENRREQLRDDELAARKKVAR